MQRRVLNIAVDQWDGVPVIQASGEIDLATAPQLRAAVTEVTAGSPRTIVFDFREVGYIDSSGLGVLIGAKRRLGEYGGDIVVIATASPVLRALSLSCLDRIFSVYRDEAAYRAERRAVPLAS